MGKLRDSLNGAQSLAAAIDARADKVGGALDRMATNTKHFADLVDNGYDQVFLYANERLKKLGKKLADSKNMKLQDIADGNLQTFVKAVEGARNEALKRIGEWKAFATKEVGALQGDLTRLQGSLADIGKRLEKKKKKLLQSKKFKDKIRTYEKLVADFAATAKQRATDLAKIPNAEPLPDNWLKGAKLGLGDTVGTVENRATMGTKALLKQYESGAMNARSNVKKFREQRFDKGMATMKQWMAESDEMEKEAPEN